MMRPWDLPEIIEESLDELRTVAGGERSPVGVA